MCPKFLRMNKLSINRLIKEKLQPKIIIIGVVVMLVFEIGCNKNTVSVNAPNDGEYRLPLDMASIRILDGAVEALNCTLPDYFVKWGCDIDSPKTIRIDRDLSCLQLFTNTRDAQIVMGVLYKLCGACADKDMSEKQVLAIFTFRENKRTNGSGNWVDEDESNWVDE